MKNEAMEIFRADYARLRAHWLAAAPGMPAPQATPAQVAGYDRWVASANNASFAAQAAYDELVPAFTALFEQQGRDWPRFYDAVGQLARQPRPQRHEALRVLLQAPVPGASAGQRIREPNFHRLSRRTPGA
jgi:predicted aminopeptidase